MQAETYNLQKIEQASQHSQSDFWISLANKISSLSIAAIITLMIFDLAQLIAG